MKIFLTILLLMSTFILSGCNDDEVKDTTPPVFIMDSIVNVNENQSYALTLKAADESKLHYYIFGDDAYLFDVNAQTGVVTFKEVADYETKTSYKFTAEVSDEKYSTQTQITIYLKNLNDSDTLSFQSPDTLVVKENAELAIDFNVSDPDFYNITYTISGEDADSLNIDSSNGKVTFKGQVDSSVKSSYNFIITATDGVVKIQRVQTINILGKTPIFRSSSNVEVDENQNYVVTLEAYNIDNDEMVFSIVDGYTDLFEVDPQSGDVRFKEYPNYEQQQSYTLEVRATTGEYSSTQTINITIKDTYELPELSYNYLSFNVKETVTIGEKIGFIEIQNNADLIDSFIITSEDNETITIAQNGDVILNKLLNYNTKSYYNFSTYATSKDGNSNSIDFTINVLEADPLYILSSVYDNNLTVEVEDDILYNYFSEIIDKNTISNNVADNYIIDGVGSISTNAEQEYNATLFLQHKIMLNQNSQSFMPNATSISLTQGLITTTNGLFPIDNNKTLVEPYRHLVTTNDFTCFDDRNISEVIECNNTHALKSDAYYKKGYTRSYVDNDNGTITDNLTRLIWQQEDDNSTRTWDDAQTYCSDLDLGDSTAWRVPTKHELESILDYSKKDPAIDPIFIDTSLNDFWTTNVYLSDSLYAWVVGFRTGYSNYRVKTDAYYVRCIHSADD